ncbi:hypothetical protein [Paraburkholderia solisilvae]|uniref:hypothetical protein n=1 Tax=Paraburkholderia solisilvae TaxID=624376 RepID=UPI0015834807|nr:hypothetical protein [Paraburkholderia solisilvae]
MPASLKALTRGLIARFKYRAHGGANRASHRISAGSALCEVSNPDAPCGVNRALCDCVLSASESKIVFYCMLANRSASLLCQTQTGFRPPNHTVQSDLRIKRDKAGSSGIKR